MEFLTDTFIYNYSVERILFDIQVINSVKYFALPEQGIHIVFNHSGYLSTWLFTMLRMHEKNFMTTHFLLIQPYSILCE